MAGSIATPWRRRGPVSRGQEDGVHLKRQVTARLLLMAGLMSAFSAAWRHFSVIPLLVVGQPRTVGQLQRDQEAPFFQTLADRTGLRLQVAYHTTDAFGLKDTHQLDALRDGRVDIVSLRFMQNIAKEPSLEGIDLPGTIPDFARARQVVQSYSPSVDGYLRKAYGAKLLGIWSFGPQVMFCRTQIDGLQDIKGQKVRVASPGLAQLISAVGGIPAILSFEDTKHALAMGIVDCAVTSAASAHFAGWTKHTQYYYPLALQFGFNGYAISLKKWNTLSEQEQQRLAQAFSRFSTRLWDYSQDLEQDSETCILSDSCRTSPPQPLTRVDPSDEDVRLLQRLSQQIVLPSWAERCERKHRGCRREWQRHVAPITDFVTSQLRQP